jgi:DNA-binding NarL/FixJ family response regulator
MTAVAIYSDDSDLRGRIEQLLREDATVTVAGVAADLPTVTRLVGEKDVDVLLTDSATPAQLKNRLPCGLRLIALVDGEDYEEALEALASGAHGVVPASAERVDLIAAIGAAARDLAVLPHALVAAFLDVKSVAAGEALANSGELQNDLEVDQPALTKRELEVLAAMADGASNKAIARRLGISFHTVKFHVAAVLAKLDADTRTEAVAKAAHLGLVML